jgi:hypothetical protein
VQRTVKRERAKDGCTVGMQLPWRGAALATTHLVVGTAAYALGHRAGGAHASALQQDEEGSTDADAIKSALLDHLEHEAYAKLAPSSVDGVGVVAIRDIPAGVDPFAAPNSHLRPERRVELTAEELQQRCSLTTIEYILDFHDSDARASKDSLILPLSLKVHAGSMVSLDASWYLNHAEDSALVNVERHHGAQMADDDGSGGGGDAVTEAPRKPPFGSYRTTRQVRAGEELLLDYREALPGVYAQMEARKHLQKQHAETADNLRWLLR